MLISSFLFQRKPESKWDYKLSRVRSPGLLCHFLHETVFQTTASLQHFYASGFYFHSLISLFHYRERQCLITTEVLAHYQTALQAAGASTITASATAPLCTPLSPPAPQSQQRAHTPPAPQRRRGSKQGLHLHSSFQPLLFLPGAQQSTAASRAASTISWWYYTRRKRINITGWSRHL